MSAAQAAFGLAPVRSLSGARVYAHAIENGLASGYATDLYKGTPVKMATDGTIDIAANGADFIGSFAGVEYTDSNGRRQFADRWAANTTGTEIVVYVYDDPGIVYEIQADGSLAQTAIGDQLDFSTGTDLAVGDGNDTTQLSTCAANATPVGAGTQGMLRVIDKNLDPDNDWGDAFTKVQVMVARHQYVTAKVAI